MKFKTTIGDFKSNNILKLLLLSSFHDKMNLKPYYFEKVIDREGSHNR